MSIQPLRVMLSSRNLDSLPFSATDKPTLTEIRRKLKAAIETLTFGSTKVFDVWINEDGPPADGTENWWQHCLTQAESADIVIVLFNGVAGGTKAGTDIGVCHAELEAAMRSGPARVHLIELPDCSGKASGKVQPINARFQDFVNKLGLFRGGNVKSYPDVEARVMEALANAVSALTRRGRSAIRRDKYDRGPALEWHRLSFIERQRTMQSALKVGMTTGHAATDVGANSILLPMEGRYVLLQLSAVPGSMTVAEARELLGRPHLADHLSHGALSKSRTTIGPLHLIACHRSVTEAQALKVLGFHDAVTVASGFGVFIADNVQMAQLAFLRDCRDDSSLRQATQLFVDWLNTSGERQEVIRRATGRKKIVKAVADANGGSAS